MLDTRRLGASRQVHLVMAKGNTKEAGARAWAAEMRVGLAGGGSGFTSLCADRWSFPDRIGGLDTERRVPGRRVRGGVRLPGKGGLGREAGGEEAAGELEGV